ncbi:hypothetical protein M127_5280 [Bacteroides fragilis str. S6L5]|nr:hypothetical protein M127_5280 [Bacteroides fragilis str. S6L5]
MTSPINNNTSTTSITTTTTAAPTVTVSTLGDHSITSVGSGAAASTAENVSSTAESVVSQSGSSSSTDSVIFTKEHSVTTTSSGTTQTTATAASLTGRRILLGDRSRSESTSSSDSDNSISSDSTVEGAPGGENPVNTETDLGNLAGLRGTVVTEGAERAEGPGGLPDLQLPSYDPTDKSSILKFLSTPSVQAKLVTKGGHIVYRDHARGSFIFVRNGDWSTACSIAVTNGRTKAPITDVGELDRCVARFCVGYETFQGDFENRVRPNIEGRTGETGDYSHLLMSMKFKTVVVYGPWNQREASGNYTPSVWRRGTKVESGEIWGDMGGFDGINWNTTTRPPQDDGISFASETHRPSGGVPPTPSGIQIPTININLGGIHTRVDVTGGTTSTSVSTGGATGDDQVSNNNNVSDENTGSVEETSSESAFISEEGSGGKDVEAGPPLPPGPPPPSQKGTNITGMSSQTLTEVLSHVRQHLDTVYDQEGNHHQGNQDLGTVVRTTENGTWQPTVLLNKNPQTDNTSKTNNDNDDQGPGALQGSPSDVSRDAKISDSQDSRRIGGGNNDDDELTNILGHVRRHLDVVYPQENGGNAIPVNQNLGNVIDAVESGKKPEPTKPETITIETTSQSSRTSKTNSTEEGVNTKGKGPRTDSKPTTSKLITPQQGPEPTPLEHLLPKLRAHLDQSFDRQGNLIGNRGKSVGGIISDFRARTGSGGLVGSLLAHTVVTSTTPQQSATIEQLPRAQTAQVLSAEEGGSQLKEAAAEVTSSLSSLLSAATPATTGRTVSTPEPETQTAVSESVGGTREMASPLSSGSPSELPQAAAAVTQTLSAVVNRLTLMQAGQTMNKAISNAEDSSSNSQGLQLMQAARQVAQQLSATLDKVTE